MRSAVNKRCGSPTRLSSTAGSWYCSGVRLRFFWEVNVLGDRYRTGLTCDENSVTPNLRFYTEDMFIGDDIQGVYVAYDVKSKRHVVDEQ